MTLAERRAQEKAEMREALAASTVTESIGRKLGDELIAAAREAVAAWYVIGISSQAPKTRLGRAILRLQDLVGRP